MTDLKELLERAAPQPHRAVDVAELDSRADRQRTRARAAGGLLAVLAVMALLATGLLLRDGSETSRIDTAATSEQTDGTQDDANTPPSTETPGQDDVSGEPGPHPVLVVNGSGRCGAAGNFADAVREAPFDGASARVLQPANGELASSSAVLTATESEALATQIASLLDPEPPIGRLTADTLSSFSSAWEGEEEPAVVVVLGDDQAQAWGGCEGTNFGPPPASEPSGN